MRKQFYVATLFCFNCVFCFAQTISIQGKLIDSLQKTTLAYGHIIIKNAKDSMLGGALADEKGNFEAKINFNDNVFLKASCLGYNDKQINLKISPNKTNVKLGDIGLSPSATVLKEVVTTANQTYVTQKFDRKVYHMKEAQISSSRTVLDLLRLLPGVVVDNDGNVKYKGQIATIFVDDQPSNYIYPKIEMIPVAQVEKIELIDAAMQSGGSGKGGIINIKLKVIKKDGLSGMLSTNEGSSSIKQLDKSDNFLNANYKKNKFTFFNNFSARTSIDQSEYHQQKAIISYAVPIEQNDSFHSKLPSSTFFNYIGTVYRPSTNTKMYMGVGLNDFKYTTNSNGVFSETLNNNLFTNLKYNSFGGGKSHQTYKGINYSYYHSFDTLDTYIRIFCSTQTQQHLFDNDTYHQYNTMYNVKLDSLLKQTSFSKSISPMSYFSVFYNYSFNNNTRWNIGYNISYDPNASDENQLYINDVENILEKSYNKRNELEQSISSRIGTKIKKWKLDAGLNANYANINGYYKRYKIDLSDTVLKINKTYINIEPSATIAYAFNDKNSLKLSLSQTNTNPYFFYLNDFVKKYSSYFWSAGNSNLKPENYYSCYFGYTYEKETFNYTSELFYTISNNKIESISYPLTSLLTMNKPDNISKKEAIGIDISSWVQLKSNLDMSLSGSIFQTTIDISSLANTAGEYHLSTDELFQKQQQYGYNVKTNINCRFKKFSTMFYVNYYSKEINVTGYKKPWINSSFNINRRFFNKKLSVSIGVNNIFDDWVEHGSYSNKFGIESFSKETGNKYYRNYNFTIRYTFRQGDRNTKDMRL